MSEQIRQEIAAAGSTVDGVTVRAYARQTTKTGDGQVRLDHIDYPQNGFGGLVTWQVVINLPADTAAGEKWLEARAVELVEVLAEVLIVKQLEQRELVLDSGRVPVVVITGIREQE